MFSRCLSHAHKEPAMPLGTSHWRICIIKSEFMANHFSLIVKHYSKFHPATTSAITAGTPFSTRDIAAAKAHIVARSFTSGT